MKIVFVITELEPGGAERNLVKLALGFKRQGHHVEVISIAGRPTRTVLIDKLDQAVIPVHYLQIKRLWLGLIAIIRLRNLLKSLRPDIVQSFLYHANLLTSLSNREKRTRHFTGFRVRDPRRLRYRILQRFSGGWAGGISVSDDVERHVRPLVGLHASNSYVIPNGVDMSTIKAAKNDVWPEDISKTGESLVFIGRLDRQKGVDILLDAATDLLLCNKERQLLLIGEGPLRSSLEVKISNSSVASQIHLLGYRSDALTLLSKAKAFLFPSRWEGMPNVVMEAMALGLPLITTPVDGVTELLGDDSHQIAIQSDWPIAAKRLLELTEEELARIGARNREIIQASFTSQVTTESYLEIYRNALQ